MSVDAAYGVELARQGERLQRDMPLMTVETERAVPLVGAFTRLAVTGDARDNPVVANVAILILLLEFHAVTCCYCPNTP
jgi:hypothetical protein